MIDNMNANNGLTQSFKVNHLLTGEQEISKKFSKSAKLTSYEKNSQKIKKNEKNKRAGDGIRTHDSLLGKQRPYFFTRQIRISS